MLAPALDPTTLAPALAARGRLQIPGFLDEGAAGLLHECLAREVPWSLAFNEGGAPRTLAAEALRALDPAARAALARRIHAEAAGGYQFMYHSYMMVAAYLAGRDPQLPLHRVLEFLNGEAFLGFARALTGVAEIKRVDAQATCYLPGDFLKRHTDADSGKGRRFAYVIGLTREWQADWGGQLQFLDDEGAVVESFLPRWNTLSIFKVPAPHCVSFVAPYARAPRLSITGWLLDT
jgi:Rps23 Pro-64 3,4-dihydroxylase Tpa1-like proline 4-hydroxylase